MPVQAEGHLPPQMDPASLQDARLALGGPNSERVLSLLRTVAQQAADTSEGQASACWQASALQWGLPSCSGCRPGWPRVLACN